MKLFRILAIALLLPCLLIGCDFPAPEQTTPQTTTPEGSTLEGTTPEATTPEVSTPDCMEPVTPPVATMKLTHVTISAGNSPAEQTALSELTKYLEARSITVAEGGYPIRNADAPYLDVTGDGTVNASDAMCLFAYLAGAFDGLPGCL